MEWVQQVERIRAHGFRVLGEASVESRMSNDLYKGIRKRSSVGRKSEEEKPKRGYCSCYDFCSPATR